MLQNSFTESDQVPQICIWEQPFYDARIGLLSQPCLGGPGAQTMSTDPLTYE